MSQKELNKYDVIKRTIRKEITVSKAGELIRLCERQIYRLKTQVKKKDVEGLIHGNRGKPSNPGLSPPRRRKKENPANRRQTILGENHSFSVQKRGIKHRLGFEKPVRRQIRDIVFYKIS